MDFSLDKLEKTLIMKRIFVKALCIKKCPCGCGLLNLNQIYDAELKPTYLIVNSNTWEPHFFKIIENEDFNLERWN